jgi:stalled ribosome rescue protein Dom34
MVPEPFGAVRGYNHRTKKEPNHEGVAMANQHAVLWIDHQHAELLHIDAEPVQSRKFKAHHTHTAQHGSQVRTEHAFFAEVCDGLGDIKEVLVTGSHQAQADFRHYVGKHRPQVAPRIAGWETVDHPSSGQLAALARKFFVKHDRMAGQP